MLTLIFPAKSTAWPSTPPPLPPKLVSGRAQRSASSRVLLCHELGAAAAVLGPFAALLAELGRGRGGDGTPSAQVRCVAKEMATRSFRRSRSTSSDPRSLQVVDCAHVSSCNPDAHQTCDTGAHAVADAC